MRLTSLAAVARRTGFPVVEEGGWPSRGVNMSGVRSVICHHDAANQQPWQFNTVVRDGRAGLAGPLSQFTIRRDSTIHVVAAGRANHAGVTINDAIWGGNYSIGIEAGNNGVGEPWPAAQYRAYVALVGELCREFGLGVDRVKGHKEIASPLGRKIDPAGIDMNTFRADVARYITSGGNEPVPPPAPVITEDHVSTLPATDGLFKSRTFGVPSGATAAVIGVGFEAIEIVHVKGFNADGGETFIKPGITWPAAKPYSFWVPAGTLTVEVAYKIAGTTHDAGFTFRTGL